MTLSSGTNRQQHVGNGSTTAFDFSYQYRAGADLRVLLTVGGVETVQTTPAHYSVSPDGGDAGTVTFVSAPISGALVTIICDEPVNQPLAVSTIQSFKSQGFQSGLDHLARIGRRAVDMATRSLRLRESDTPGAGAYDVGGNRLTNLAASSAPSDAARKDELTALAGTLAPVATSGAYADLTGKPTLGTASAQNVEAFATAAQGSKADTAVQPAGLTKAAVGLGNVDNTSDANKPVSSATADALALKANTSSLGTAAGLNTGTTGGTIPLLVTGGALPAVGGANLTGISKGQVGLGNVDNTADLAKPISTLTQTALNLKANTSSLALVATSGAYGDLTGKPTLGTAAALNTGTASGTIPLLGASGLPAVGGSLLTGMTKTQVGLSNVDNTSDATKNAAVATLTNKTLTAPVINNPTGITKANVGLGSVDNTADSAKPVSGPQQTALNLKANTADLAAVATSGAYADLTGRPTIPAAQVNSDWTAASGVAAILNKPTFGSAAAQDAGYFAVAAAGVPVGGGIGQILTKASATDRDLTWSNPAGGGDMQSITYDPNNIAADAFDMDSMVEGVTAKILTAAERVKLASIADGATANTGTVTSVGLTLPTGFTVSGSPVSVSGTLGAVWATGYQPYTTAEANKLSAIAANATANSSDATLLNRANHTGAQAISTVTNLQTTLDGKAGTAAVTTSVNGLMIAADKVKLNAIASGATANDTDANLKNRANHTGTQTASTITGLAGVATSGAYGDLSGLPTLGSAAAQNTSAFATAAQGTTADAALPRAGGTMTGKITLDGAPTADLHAATKKYVDDAGGGKIAQVLQVSYGTAATLTDVIPLDNTVPTSSEGTEVLSLNITPETTASKVLATVEVAGYPQANGAKMIVALFRGSTCIQARAMGTSATVTMLAVIPLELLDSPATAGAITYSVRVGPSTGNLHINRYDGSTAAFGAAGMCTLTLMEILP